jgi:hypothetical protein
MKTCIRLILSALVSLIAVVPAVGFSKSIQGAAASKSYSNYQLEWRIFSAKNSEKQESSTSKSGGIETPSVSSGLSAVELAKRVVNRRIEEIRQDRRPNRVLGRHDFISTSMIESPFVTSHAELRTISGLATYERSSFFDQEQLAHTFGVISQGADIQISFFDQFALRGGAAGNAYIAVDEDTAQSLAGFGGFNAGGGFKFKILRIGSFQLATSHDYRYDKNFASKTGPTWSKLDGQIENAKNIVGELRGSSNPAEVLRQNADAISDLINTDVDTENIFEESSAHWYRGGLQMGYGVTDVLGLFIDSNLRYDLGNGDVFMEAGGGFSVDLADSTFLPIGFNGFYLQTFPLDAGDDANSPRPLFIPTGENDAQQPPKTRVIGGGIYYTDMKYTDIGLEVDRIKRTDLDNFRLLEGKIRLRVYF